MARKRSRINASPGPSKTLPSTSPAIEPPMDVDPPVATPPGRVLSDDILRRLAGELRLLPQAWDDWSSDGSDTVFDESQIIAIYSLVWTNTPRPNNLVRSAFVKKNRSTQSALDFTNSFKAALEADDLELWRLVVTHDVFYTVIPEDPAPIDDRVPRSLKEEAITKSWVTPFIGTAALEALRLHVLKVLREKDLYGPYCSIVQSSGMGKSRLLHEFSKSHFVIPINLRKKDTQGFPPPDHAIRDLLSQGNGEAVYVRMLQFFLVLFEKTTALITNQLQEAENRSARITEFRDFMAEGQTGTSVGENRQTFYEDIAAVVETRMNKSNAKPDITHVKNALDGLIRCLGPRQETGTGAEETNAEDPGSEYLGSEGSGSGVLAEGLPDVFVVFDEAHSLTEVKTRGNRTAFIELRSAVRDVERLTFFSFFLSTTSKISQFAVPKDIDESDRMAEEFIPSLPFSDLGFDHLMHDRKIFDKFKTIGDVTSTDCIVHMGRPLWGTIFDSSDLRNQGGILTLAVAKLLCASGNPNELQFTVDQECAILSQRLALEINSSTYETSGSTRNYDMSEKVQLQISSHMRVCIDIPEDLTTVRGIAASEPILSEAASYIMRRYTHFDLSDALLHVLKSYAISHGERGELLVAAFFMKARDLYVPHIEHHLFPYKLSALQFCPIFSVVDLLSKLFKGKHLKTMLESVPSIRRPGFSPKKKFKNVFKNTSMHFNHMIQPFKISVITQSYLLTIMARGAAALGANCQPGYDMVFPFLYDSHNLILENLGFIIVQVKNYARYLKPREGLFELMDPFLCQLLERDNLHFTVPIIRIVFALGGDEPKLEHMVYEAPELGASAETFGENGRPQFTSYDFWCSGIGPDLLHPVGNDKIAKWRQLLGKTDKWDGLFSKSKALDVRCSQYPGGGDGEGHYNAWCASE